MKIDNNLIEYTLAIQRLVSLGWKFEFFTDNHHLGIVPCMVVVFETEVSGESYTFYSINEFLKWHKGEK